MKTLDDFVSKAVARSIIFFPRRRTGSGTPPSTRVLPRRKATRKCKRIRKHAKRRKCLRRVRARL